MAGSEFAKRQLKKHGWTEGSGLGKQENGRHDPIKVTLKMDKTGVGHDPGKEFTDHWWLRVFNEAAQKIGVKKDVVDGKKTREKKMAEDKKQFYKGFVKSSTLTNGVETKDKGSDVSSEEDSDVDTSASSSLPTLDDIHKFCGGATGHRAARFGIKMKGKLARAAEHEKLFEEKLKGKTDTTMDSSTEGSVEVIQPTIYNDALLHAEISHENSSDKKSKKKKKKRKREESPSAENVNELYDSSDQETPSQKKTKDPSGEQIGKISKKKKHKQEMLSEDVNNINISLETGTHPQMESVGMSAQDNGKKSKKKRLKKEKIHIPDSTLADVGADDITQSSERTEETGKEKKKQKRDKADAINSGENVDNSEVKSQKKKRKKDKGETTDESENVGDEEVKCEKKKKRKKDVCQDKISVTQEESNVTKKKRKR